MADTIFMRNAKLPTLFTRVGKLPTKVLMVVSTPELELKLLLKLKPSLSSSLPFLILLYSSFP